MSQVFDNQVIHFWVLAGYLNQALEEIPLTGFIWDDIVSVEITSGGKSPPDFDVNPIGPEKITWLYLPKFSGRKILFEPTQ